MSIKTDQRAKSILQVLLRHGNIAVDELAAELGASAASVRRDLTRLEQRGLVHRTHGGAKLAGQTQYEPFRFDSSFQEREGRFAAEKRRIGLAAATLLPGQRAASAIAAAFMSSPTPSTSAWS